jgi:predicted permease
VTVIGVASAEFNGADVGVRPDLWMPMAANRIVRPNPDLNWYETRRGLFVFAIGRLKPGVSLAAARAEAAALSRRLQQEYPDDDRGRSFRLVPLAEAAIPFGLRGGVIAMSGLLATVVGLVLLVACANVANLLLARAAARRKEIAVRLSIGAGRGRLIRQLLTESVLLALLGGACGLLVAAWASRALVALIASVPFGIATDLHLGLDPRVLLFTLGLSLVTGLVFGLAPALQASRPELVTALKSQAPPPSGAGRRLTGRNLLVAAQVAFSLVTLIAAGLFLRSLGAAQRTDPGFETERLLTLNLDLDLGGYDPARGQIFVRQMIERVSAVPAVLRAAVAQAGPLQGSYARSVFLEGQDASKSGTLIQINGVGPRYFETVGVPLVRGRAFTEGDREGAPPVVVVNQTLAAKFWPGRDPIGQRFRFFGDKFLVEVVGVAKDVKYNTLGEDPQPYIYLPLAQRYGGTLTLVARTAGDPAAVLPTVEREVRGMDKDLPVTNAATVSRVLGDGLWAPRAGASLLAVFGLLALVLAAVGIYGVTSFSVARRAREIGIRMALGARRGTVLGMVLAQGMTVVAIGLAAGVLAAASVSRLAAGLLFGISPTDPLAFGVTSLLLAAVALAANLLPARRATAVDPVTALRQE